MLFQQHLQATVRLFHAILVETKEVTNDPSDHKRTMERTIPYGYVLDPVIPTTDELLKMIESTIGCTAMQANATFHKSWKTVQDSSMETLFLQQAMHYLTTYGFESLGSFRHDCVYIPHEPLDIPKLSADIPLVCIRAMDADEILACILELASSGIALSEQVLADIMEIVKADMFHPRVPVERVLNRELKTSLCEYYDIVPSEPVDYLRHLIKKLTGDSLVIKNDALIKKIKAADGVRLDELLEHAPDDLASIFLRYKPLFLAFKSISLNKTFFNRLRKKAVALHKPLPEDYLNTVTGKIKHGELDVMALEKLQKSLDRALIFRKIRLAYALKHRLHATDSIVFRIRNGRGWATGFDWPEELGAPTREALKIVQESIVDSLGPQMAGKTIYVPKDIHYALPATEKQFTGNIPTGSFVTVPEDLVVGIHWCNTTRRIDLDLSVVGVGGKIGWDGQYRSSNNEILFSGDVTDAPIPNGATELFYVKKGIVEPQLLLVNFYNYSAETEVPIKLMVARESPQNFGENYVIDPGNIICSADIRITQKEMVLGLITNAEGENRVYFANMSIGNSITSGGEVETYCRNYLYDSMVHSLDLRSVFGTAGAVIVEERPGEDEDFIDLSPTSLDKTTMISLISGANGSAGQKQKFAGEKRKEKA